MINMSMLIYQNGKKNVGLIGKLRYMKNNKVYTYITAHIVKITQITKIIYPREPETHLRYCIIMYHYTINQ